MIGKALGLLFRHDDHHADPAIEGPEQTLRRHLGDFVDPAENGRCLPTTRIDLCHQAGGQNSRYIFDQTTAGDMG